MNEDVVQGALRLPKRTKNHRTGKAAVTEFMRLASDTWEVREKSGDYGVDLEIEVFSPDDSATGTVAYVQSKGTTSNENVPSVSIRVETLQYLNSFDVPSIIFCSSTSTGNSFWMWAQEAISYAKPEANTVTLKFRKRHLWNDATTIEIERSLRANRLLRTRNNYIPFPILVDEQDSTLDPTTLNSVAAEVAIWLPFTDPHKSGDGITLTMSVRDSSVQIRIERFLWRGIRARSESQTDLVSAIMYLLTAFWRELGFVNHAERAALKCVQNRVHAPNRDIAAEAAIVLINRPRTAVELALVNELHSTPDVATNLFFVALKYSLAENEEKTESLKKFFYESSYSSIDKLHISALQYNIGKFFRNSHQYFEGVSAYNNLRKIDSSYLGRTYYWYELGGILFQTQKYRMAAICYEKLVRLEQLPVTYLILGDTYLYGNRPAEAENAFSSAKDDFTSIGAEATLKFHIAQWIQSFSKTDRPSPSARCQLLSLRKFALGNDDLETAFWSHMALTFMDVDDIECWADAIFLSLRFVNISLFEDVLRCATKTHGLKSYIKFKADRADFFDHLGDLREEMDRRARDILHKTRAEQDYEPGVSIGEPEELLKQGVLRLTSKF